MGEMGKRDAGKVSVLLEYLLDQSFLVDVKFLVGHGHGFSNAARPMVFQTKRS